MGEPLRLVDVNGRELFLYPTDRLDIWVDERQIPVLSIEPDGTPKLLHQALPHVEGVNA